MSTIPVIVEAQANRPDTLGILDREIIQTTVKNIDLHKVQSSLQDLVEHLSSVIRDDEIKMGRLMLTELQVNIEITAEGGVALIGTAKAGIKGAISLKFSRDAVK